MYEEFQAPLKALLILLCQEGVSRTAVPAEQVTPPFLLSLLLESWHSRPKEISFSLAFLRICVCSPAPQPPGEEKIFS